MLLAAQRGVIGVVQLPHLTQPRQLSAAVHPYTAAGAFDGQVMVWDIGSGQPLHTYKGHTYQVTAVVLLPTGDIASASVDK
jgi:WD40 repeat protein